MFCINCGAKLADSDAFCSHCGVSTGVPNPSIAADPYGRPQRLTRSIYDKKIAGVCGGLGQYLNMDSTLVRLVWLVISICFPPLILGYIAAWIIVPREAPRLAPAFEPGVPQPNL